MPDMVTLRDLVSTFTEQELDMTVPFDFKNPTVNTVEYAKHYNSLLAAGKWQEAQAYRVANASILEPMIHDANALNRQQAMMINTYLFAKGEKSAANTRFDNTLSGVNAETVQAVLDILLAQLGGYTVRKVKELPEEGLRDNNTIYLVTG